MSIPEVLLTFVSSYIGQVVFYFALTGLLILATRRMGARYFARWRIRIRGRRRVDRAQLMHEARHSLIVMAVGTAQVIVIQLMHAQGWTRFGEGAGPWGVWGVIAAVVGLVLLNDLWFYTVHRALHTRWLFKHVHWVHHRSVDVTPLTSYSFHVVEALLITSWLIPAALLVPIHMPALIATQLIGLINNLMAHLGFELFPRWWVRSPVLRWSNTATFHSLHHQYSRGNYGLFTRLWDRLFGTELDGYEAAFVEACEGRGEEAEEEAVAATTVNPSSAVS